MIGRDAEILAESYEGGVHSPRSSTADQLSWSRVWRRRGVQRCLVRGASRRDPGHVWQPRRRHDRGGSCLLRPGAATSGTIRLDGARIAPRTTRRRNGLGIAYLTENRRATIFPRHEIFKNISLAHLDQIVGGVVRQKREVAIAGTLVQADGCATAEAEMLAGNLSGGNQQKVVLAKWLTVQPKVLILNEPTRGMDVGAKREVLDLIKALKAEGVAIILISTEPETVLAESDRILVHVQGTDHQGISPASGSAKTC